MMNAVGGTTLHYWAQSWRLNPWDFKVVSETTRRYGASRIPKGSTVEDWPFGLEELEPYYDKVEHEIGVSGKAGNINGHDRPARQHLRGAARARVSDAAAARHRLHRHDGRRARERSAGTRSPGRRRSIHARYQNRVGVRVSRLLQPRRLPREREGLDGRHDDPEGAGAPSGSTVVTEAHVTTIDVDDNGRVTGVTYLKGGTEYFQPAGVVLLASYVYENVRLLLLSKSKAFPERALEQPRPGRPALLQPQPGAQASPRCFRAT